MSFRRIKKEVVNFEVNEISISYPYQGVFQPMRSRDIELKPEGQRNWKWWTLYCKTQYDIDNYDRIEDFKGKKFRVMKTSDWAQAGFCVFELVEDFEHVNG